MKRMVEVDHFEGMFREFDISSYVRSIPVRDSDANVRGAAVVALSEVLSKLDVRSTARVRGEKILNEMADMDSSPTVRSSAQRTLAGLKQRENVDGLTHLRTRMLLGDVSARDEYHAYVKGLRPGSKGYRHETAIVREIIPDMLRYYPYRDMGEICVSNVDLYAGLLGPFGRGAPEVHAALALCRAYGRYSWFQERLIDLYGKLDLTRVDARAEFERLLSTIDRQESQNVLMSYAHLLPQHDLARIYRRLRSCIAADGVDARSAGELAGVYRKFSCEYPLTTASHIRDELNGMIELLRDGDLESRHGRAYQVNVVKMIEEMIPALKPGAFHDEAAALTAALEERMLARARDIVEGGQSPHGMNEARLYGLLVEYYMTDASDDIVSAERFMRGLIKQVDWSFLDSSQAADIYGAYERILRKVPAGSHSAVSAAALLAPIIERVVSTYDEEYSSMGMELRAYGAVLQRLPVDNIDLPMLMRAFNANQYAMDVVNREVFKENFHYLHQNGLWQQLLRGPFFDQYGLSSRAREVLRAFADEKSFHVFYDNWRTLLASLREMDNNKREVISAILASTKAIKSKQIKKTLRVLRRLNELERLSHVVDPENPDVMSKWFYAQWARKGRVDGDLRTAVIAHARETFMEQLRARLPAEGLHTLLFLDAKPASMSGKEWDRISQVQGYLYRKGLLGLFATASTFMSDEGNQRIAELLGDIAGARIVKGELDSWARYERMIAHLGFSEGFTRKWSKDWNQSIVLGKAESTESGMRAALFKMCTNEFGRVLEGTESVTGKLADLPGEIEGLAEQLRRGNVDVMDVIKLRNRFDRQYAEIFNAYGGEFANLRMYLKMLHAGLAKGFKKAKKESVEVSGGLIAMARHGVVPAATCQRLTEGTSVNERGEPVNRVRWGQFKVANYVMDGNVTARRLLEVTMDADGREHLLVECLYVGGAFPREVEFNEAIIRYATELGISRDRVHFLNRDGLNVPLPLSTGDLIYRDSALPERDPVEVKPSDARADVVEEYSPRAMGTTSG
jgi:hypothetical protein